MTRRIDIWVESAGLGHVVRQVNLSGYLATRAELADVRIRFLVDDCPATLEAAGRSGHDVKVRSGDISAAFRDLADEWRAAPPAAFILDSVDHDRNPAAAVALNDPRVYTVVVMDDPNDRDVDCDLLINALPSMGARSSPERSLAGRRIYGPEFLILAPEFSAIRSERFTRRWGNTKKGFAFFGGADLQNFSSIFAESVASAKTGLSWTLLLGPSYAGAQEVIGRVAEIPEVTVVRHVPDIAGALLDADIAVLAAGNTLSEAAAVGTPAIVFSQNSVQANNAAYFAGRCGVINLGSASTDAAARLASAIKRLALGRDERKQMSESMIATVDAKGGARVAEIIAEGIQA